MNCLQCTFYNEVDLDLSKKNYCAVCNAELILTDETFNFQEWLEGIGLGNLRGKVGDDILNSINLEKDLDTSSKVSRKHAIMLAYHVGIHKGEKEESKRDKTKSKEKILEERLIMQEQDLKSEISILQEKLEESEKKVRELSSKSDAIINTSILSPKVESIQEPEPELTREERRRMIADSWLNKI